MIRSLLPMVPLLLALAGCEQVNQRLGLEDPAKKEARLQAEGRAVGSACRQSGRAIEDCYTIYYWLPKSPIFEGWREMNDYMIENKMAATPEHPTTVAADAGEAAVDEAAPSVQGEKGEKTDPGAKKSR